MDKPGMKSLNLSNSLQNLLFPPGKYNAHQLINLCSQFTGTLTLEKYKELMGQKLQMSNEQRIWWVVNAEYGQVNAKVLLIILMLQLFGKEKKEHDNYNEASKNIQHSSSPRNKSNRALIVNNEQILILHYVKENMHNFLRLLSNEPQTQDPLISPQQLQPLSVIFRVDRNKPFSSYLPIFNGVQKQKASIIAEHLTSRIAISQQQIVNLEGLRFSVMIKQVSQCKDKDVKIIGCYDSEIFIDSPVRSLYVVACGSCNIYVAACEKIALLDKCQKISLTITTNLLRVSNSMDSTIYSYNQSPTILTGDNRSICLGPNNSSSKDLKNHMKAACLGINKNYINQFENVICRSEANCFQIMKPSDFDILVLPIKQNEENSSNGSDLSILAPQIYIKQLEQRNNYYNTVKNNISKGGLNTEMQKHLHSSLQGHFKDWLIAKGHNKNLIDLVKMIDKK